MGESFIIAHVENTVQNRKNKYFPAFERGEITALHDAEYSNQEIARRSRACSSDHRQRIQT